LAWPSPARGCSSDYPTFREAVVGAEAIALVEVVDTPGDPMNQAPQTLKVIEVVKGSLPSTVVVDPPRTDLCGDTIGFWAEQLRPPTLLVAFNVSFYDQAINPIWGERRRGSSIFGTASVPAGATTLEEVMAAARRLVPDTAMHRPGDRADLALLGAALLALAALGGRRAVTRRRPG
jgi:hypothetical protein